VTDLQSVRDELDIQRVIHDYAWACDNSDWGLLKSVFTDDAHLDYASAGGPAGPRDDVVVWLEQSLSQLKSIQHVVSNFQIDLSGDSADLRAMFFCSILFPEVDDVLFTGGFYQEGLVRTSDGWKIRRLVEHNQWMKGPAPS
jgi:SnoaL-like domain